MKTSKFTKDRNDDLDKTKQENQKQILHGCTGCGCLTILTFFVLIGILGFCRSVSQNPKSIKGPLSEPDGKWTEKIAKKACGDDLIETAIPIPKELEIEQINLYEDPNDPNAGAAIILIRSSRPATMEAAYCTRKKQPSGEYRTTARFLRADEINRANERLKWAESQ